MSKKKQEFYQNHSGGSINEINIITVVILLGHVAFLSCQRAGLIKRKLDHITWGFVCYFMNVLLAITVYSDKHYVLVLLYTGLILITSLFSHQAQEKTKSTESKPRVAYLSVFRATMMITTILAILAVDLPIFPRRYAKSETWGTSLMDLGVGSFVFSSGVVSSTLKTGFLGGFKQAGLLGAMGIIRALMVRGTGYHEHISEYGTHWNFFITLSLLPPLLPIFRALKDRGIGYLAQGIVICIGYQTILIYSLQVWVIAAPRTNIISANKEGIASFIGYAAIYLFGLDAGSLVLSKKKRPVLPLLFISSASFWAAYVFTISFFGYRVSRRLANAPYMLWVGAHNSTFLFALACIEYLHTTIVKQPVPSSKLLDRINSKGLYVFLGANLLTGAINLYLGDAMMTTSTVTGLAILHVYALLITLAVA